MDRPPHANIIDEPFVTVLCSWVETRAYRCVFYGCAMFKMYTYDNDKKVLLVITFERHHSNRLET
ncbi:hypothetical protein Lal_00030183 [Lupinus albus]|nr:hypothetical protein Lal_00030183 [Lupinus albus]